MMIEEATVIEYKDGIALVQCYAKTSCGGCNAQSVCGSKALSALAGEKFAPRFSLPVEQVLHAGDRIKIGLAENALLKGVFLIYGLPLLVLITTAVIFSQFFANELITLVGVLFSTTITFWTVKKLMDKRSHQNSFLPVFLGKI